MWLQSNEAKYNKASHPSFFPIKMINALFINLLYVQAFFFSLTHKSTFHKKKVIILKYHAAAVNIYILLVLLPGSYGSMTFSEI